ncbi:MAG: alcohol dehydrogenase catalytic domain-containing protein [Phycisphaerales bacterium]|nr:MAG: alcohol dehydrogenase catalytic domain-containing protein [Phycisphaerales bacterium]
MRAVVLDKGLRYEPDYPKPQPGEGQCLVRVHMAGICATDLQLVKGYMDFKGVVGHEFVGTVASGPANLKNKRVACEINFVCRKCELCLAGLATHCPNRTVLGISNQDGCFADYVVAPEHNLHPVPDSVSDEEAVFVEPLAAAYQVLAQCPVEERTKITVIGSGRLGLLVAQALKTKGCKLTVVGRNKKTLTFCEKKGIQGIHVDKLVARQDRDVVVECSGAAEGLTIAMELVRPRGTIVLKSTHAEAGALNLAPIVVNEVNLLGSRCGPFGEAINALARQAVDVRSMISKTFPIEKALEAFKAAEDRNNVKVLLKMNAK